MLASPRLNPVTANLSLPEKREYLALLEQRSRLKREREERERIEAEAGGWEAEKARCAADPLYWFDKYAWTYDPRLVGKPGGAFVRFILWPKQREFITWLLARVDAGEEGLGEKSRDVGVTYLCGGFALWACATTRRGNRETSPSSFIMRNPRPTALALPRFHHRKPSSYMKYSTLTVLRSGPPCVITYGSANSWK